MSLACKPAIVERDVAHLIFPDEVAGLPRPDARPAARRGASPTTGWRRPRAPSPAIGMLRPARRPVIIMGHGAGRCRRSSPWPSARRPGGHHLQGQGPDRRRASRNGHPLGCGVLGRSGTPIASWFMNEADLILALGASFSNHTGIDGRSRSSRSTSNACSWAGSTRSTAGVGRDRSPSALLAPALADAAASTTAPELAERWAMWREEKERRLRDDRGRGRRMRRRVRRADAAVPGRRHHRRSTSATTPIVSAATSRCRRPARADVGLSRLDRLRLPAALGAWAATQERRVPRPQGGRRSPATAASASTPWSSPPRSSTAWTSPTCCSTTPAGQDHQGAARRRLAGVGDHAAQPRASRCSPRPAAPGLRVERQAGSWTTPWRRRWPSRAVAGRDRRRPRTI